jgi:hypothetical protein
MLRLLSKLTLPLAMNVVTPENFIRSNSRFQNVHYARCARPPNVDGAKKWEILRLCHSPDLSQPKTGPARGGMYRPRSFRSDSVRAALYLLTVI